MAIGRNAKKSFLFYSLFFLSVLIPSSTFGKEKKDTLKFLNLTDIHLILNPANYHSNFIQGRYKYFWENAEPFKEFLKTNPLIKETDFMVITGDMVDFYEAETKDGELLGTQIEQFQNLLSSSINSTVYLILGNHDITSYPKGRYHQNNSAVARAEWIRNSPVFNQGTYYSRMYSVGETVYRLIFLDNAYFSGRTNKEHADFVIDRYQLDWLRAQLNESAEDKEIIFMHMPLPLVGKNEETNSIDISYEEYLDKTNTRDFLNIIKESENSSAPIIIAGHWHVNNITRFNFSEEFNFYQILTGAFGNDVNNWRLVKLTDSSIIISEPGESKHELIIPVK